jgi:serine/threonine protein kinase/tetratricopeptide (TPR) repeat protein
MIGKTISHYKILEKLGEGGMGVVYKAEDTKLKRTVALKFLPNELTRDEEAKRRFIQEAQAASALDHSNICTIFEVNETREGQSYIVMAYYEGETLKDKIKDKKQKIKNAVDITIQIAQGLAEAHENGVVHRDIKPANILLTKKSDVKILDFGLAKLSGQTRITKTGTTVGTIAYMSPEQLRSEVIDHRTDIWSLGVVLYEMVTGQLPFKGEYEQAMIYSILNETFPPAESINPEISKELEQIISHSLEKDPTKRYQSATDLIIDLQYMEREVEARSGIPQLSIARPAGRKPKMRWWYWVVPLITIVFGTVLVFYQWPQGTRGPVEKYIAVLPFVDISLQQDQGYFCDGITEELINRLSNIQDLRVPARTSAFVFKGKTADIQEIGSKLKVQQVLEGSVRKAGDQLRITVQFINVADGYHLWSKTYDRELKDVFTIQDEIATDIVSALQLKLTPQETHRLSEHPIDNVKAYEYYLKAWYQIYRFNEKSLDSAFIYLRTALDIMGDNAQLFAGMAYAYWQYANLGMGQEEYLEQAEKYANKALALKSDLPGALVMLGILAAYKDSPEGLYNSFRYKKKALSTNPYSIEVLRSMAIDYAQIGKSREGLVYADKFEQRDPLNPWRYAMRGLCYFYGCQFGRAVEQFRAFYQVDSTSRLALDLYSTGLASNAQNEEALAIINKMEVTTERNVETIFCLLLKYVLLKDRQNVERLMTPEFQKTCRRDFEWSYIVASRLSLLGEKEDALDWLENAVNRGFINYPFLQCDPFLDNIRGELRFKKLMKRVQYEWENFEVPEN